MPVSQIKVTAIRAVVPFRLQVTFSDGSGGIFDAAGMLGERGEGVESLRDRRYFGRVELANGTPTWPNYYTLSPAWLREEMDRRGELMLPGQTRGSRAAALDEE